VSCACLDVTTWLGRLVVDETERGPSREYGVVELVSVDVAERLALGEPDALEECYRTLGPLVFAYIGRYVPRADIEDVLQRVFYEVWRVHDRYDPRRSLRGWVLGIARKRAIDHLRRRKDAVPLDSIREITGEDGREIVERMIWADEVSTALGQLPEVQREVIQMAYYQGYTQSEISAELAIPIGTVKTRTARGLQRLAGLLEGSREGR
jgi:RNA polymerase sigma factor (sigma-70 family)